MGKLTEIAWTHHTFNPWWGCVRVSPGCEHCYAETFSKRVGLKVWGSHADRRFFGDRHWAEPLTWNREAEKAGERRRVFCASMADVFEDRPELDEWRCRLWDLIADTPMLDWQLLTKRPENVLRLAGKWNGTGWPSNVWLGVTAENQEYADKRIPVLLGVPAAVHFVSAEPLLGPLDLVAPLISGLDWVIVGGESGAGARPFILQWAQDIVMQCADADVPCFMKQLGAMPFEDGDHEGPLVPKMDRIRLKDRKGGDWDEWPWRTLKVRQFPEASR